MKLKIALLICILSIGFHLYMNDHYQGVVFGNMAGTSACNISAVFSCDSASASSYAVFLGIPIAAWGAGSHFVLLLLLATWAFGFAQNLVLLGRVTFLLSSVIALTSVVMGLISTFLLKTYCPFCLVLYALSFINFYLVSSSQESDDTPFFSSILSVFTNARGYLIFALLIPFFAYSLDWSASRNRRMQWPESAIQDAYQDWQDFRTIGEPKASIERGETANPRLVIAEFADFLCGHCKSASQSLKVFLSSRPDIHFKFYSFPLDSSCNKEMQYPGGNGVRCYLAKLALCAESEFKKGWDVHDAIFAEQETLLRVSQVSQAKEKLAPRLSNLNINADNLETCINAESTKAVLDAQIDAAREARIRGTPAFLVNGRILPEAPVLPLLEMIYQKSK
jgi:protein-disulfide isomerase/uncharacterized membrane protein